MDLLLEYDEFYLHMAFYTLASAASAASVFHDDSGIPLTSSQVLWAWSWPCWCRRIFHDIKHQAIKGLLPCLGSGQQTGIFSPSWGSPRYIAGWCWMVSVMEDPIDGMMKNGTWLRKPCETHGLEGQDSAKRHMISREHLWFPVIWPIQTNPVLCMVAKSKKSGC